MTKRTELLNATAEFMLSEVGFHEAVGLLTTTSMHRVEGVAIDPIEGIKLAIDEEDLRQRRLQRRQDVAAAHLTFSQNVLA